MSTVLKAEAVSKQFRLQQDRPRTLHELSVRWFSGRHNRARILWALRDVSFSVEQGLVLGIIGHNGAGKSTLLRLLCGLGRPSSGRVRREGFVSGLLELGGGFHPDLTGRENILTAGLLNGLTKRQVRAAEEEIIAFAELEQFIEQPMRTYSSGMYLRLAFAVAMHFNPDVLILDEVLAVGDARFQQKCLDRLASFRKAGKTLILTSHDSAQVQSLCDEVLVLEEGRVVMQGDPESAVRSYHDLMRQRTEKRAAQFSDVAAPLSAAFANGSRQGTQEATICDVRFYDARGQATDYVRSGDCLTIILEYRLLKSLPDLSLTLGIFNDAHVKCFEASVSSTRAVFGNLATMGELRCHFPVLPLIAGRYYVNLGLYPTDWQFVYDYHWQMHPFQVVNGPEVSSHVSGVVLLSPVWSVLDKTEPEQTKHNISN
jgi:lipopolysaccharide transport system ATP-binding protein